MMSVEEIREKMMNYSIRSVAGAIGVHENALYRMMSGQTDPSYRTLKKLSDYLEGR